MEEGARELAGGWLGGEENHLMLFFAENDSRIPVSVHEAGNRPVPVIPHIKAEINGFSR